MTSYETKSYTWGLNHFTPMGFWQILDHGRSRISLTHELPMYFKVTGERNGMKNKNCGSPQSV